MRGSTRVTISMASSDPMRYGSMDDPKTPWTEISLFSRMRLVAIFTCLTQLLIMRRIPWYASLLVGGDMRRGHRYLMNLLLWLNSTAMVLSVTRALQTRWRHELGTIPKLHTFSPPSLTHSKRNHVSHTANGQLIRSGCAEAPQSTSIIFPCSMHPHLLCW